MLELEEEKKLRNKLFLKRENGAKMISDCEISDSEKFSEEYKNYLNRSKTERENVLYILGKALENGFYWFDKNKKYSAGDKVVFINKNCSIVLAVIGKNGVKNGAKLAVAHIDAPRLDLKPNPLFESGNLAMLKTHYYGGIKKYQWTTIPLALHGLVYKRDGSSVEIVLGENNDEPCFCVTDLLPHLANEQINKKMSEAIRGEDLNVMFGSLPYKEASGFDLVKFNILRLLNEKYGMVEEDFVASDLKLVPAGKARDVGLDRSMIGGYAHDDRSCAYSCLEAILNCTNPAKTTISFFVDKEETGSDGNTGMKSKFLEYFISDLADMDDVSPREAITKSKCLSADVNAAFDPTYSSNYDLNNSSYINRGVVLTKYTGSGGKYGTSDASAEYTGEICKLLSDNGVLWQSSELGIVDNGGGGTIAKYIANLNMDVIDVGVPVLSMHAPFEVISKIDLYMTYKAILTFFTDYDES